MACNDIITIIPSGCLAKRIITLLCKSPGEVKPYWFSVANRMLSTDYITNVVAQPALDSKVTVDKIEIYGQTFKCKIRGGQNNHNVGIRFVVITHEENILEFDCKLPIRQSGALETNGIFSNVLDATSPSGTITIGTTTTLESGSKATVENIGTDSAAVFNFGIPKGDDGVSATVTVGQVTKGEAGSDPIVTNSGTVNAAILNFTLPTGENGESPTIQIGKTTTLPAGHDATVEATTADNVVTLNFGIPSGTTGEAGQYILNIGTVTTLSPGQDATAEIVSDGKGNHSLNLGIPQGADGKDGISPTLSIGTVTSLSPGEQPTAEIVHGSDGKDTLDLGLVKGDKGDPGESFQNNGTVAIDVESTTTQFVSYSDLIANDVSITASAGAINQNGFYTEPDQSAYQGQFITQIGLSVKTEGTMTVFIIDNFDTSSSFVVASKVLNLKKDQLWYDFNMYLPTHMYLSICSAGKDTGVFYYDNKKSSSFKYMPANTNTWLSVNGSLNMGVKVKNTNNIYSPFKNKKIAIIGDSISTFNKYNGGLNAQYPFGDVTSVNDTWWMQLVQKTGAELTCNSSKGGSCVAGDMQQRLHSITENTEICFIFAGTNDLVNQEFGTFSPEKKAYDPTITTIPDGQSSDYFNLTQFCDAACNLIVMLQTYYPTTKFIWITPLPRFTNNVGNIPYNKNGQSVQSYTDQIKEICNYYFIDYIDSMRIGINAINQTNFLIDNLHPNLAGMTRLSEFIQNNY